MWYLMIAKSPAPLARADSTKSMARALIVTLSATRKMGGTKDMAKAMMVLLIPGPRAPATAMANSMGGNA